MTERTVRRGTPIAVHVVFLLAATLITGFLVNVLVVLGLPPRPPAVTPDVYVFAQFAEGFRAVGAGQAPQSSAGAEFRIEASAPRDLPLSPPFAGRLRERLATQLGIAPNRVVVAFEPTPHGDVLFVRMMERGDAPRPEGHREHRLPPPPDDDRAAPPLPPPPPEPPLFEPGPRGVVLLARYTVAAKLDDGRWLVYRQRASSADSDWVARVALSIGGTLLVVLIFGAAFARRLAAPIQRFAEAAQRVGVDPRGDPVEETGPRELRAAARAVNAMQARLRLLVADRTEMLAAVAHDLRTPLMRMRLAAENTEPAVRDALARDAAEIDALVASFIAFARDDAAQDARVRLDYAALAQSVVDDRVATGGDATYVGPDRVVITGQTLALKRLLTNLVDNAVRYGEAARVEVRVEEGRVVTDVRDRGPGVPHDRREDVFQPFVRLDPDGARGAGLGLAVVRSVARAHGGDATIVDVSEGGCIRVWLPL